ncbi:MAG: class I SAM-dependent methyltransferase [bacterium]|nr:class I SAM-dependent methyltransferase [bacterium]
MRQPIIDRLNAINHTFYQACAADFDATRAGAWPGWARLLPLLPTPADCPFAVLDAGCGNGRLGVYLAHHLNAPLHYHGVDFSANLLQAARAALDVLPNVQVTLETRDLTAQPLDAGAYDRVAAVGVLQHIPGGENRAQFVRTLADRVRPGGVLVWTEWRFAEFPRFQRHIIAPPPDLIEHLEPGDHLLDWGGSEGAAPDVARRYCHYIDDAESERLIAATRLTLEVLYRADGHTRTTNRYVVLRRQS